MQDKLHLLRFFDDYEFPEEQYFEGHPTVFIRTFHYMVYQYSSVVLLDLKKRGASVEEIRGASDKEFFKSFILLLTDLFDYKVKLTID